MVVLWSPVAARSSRPKPVPTPTRFDTIDRLPAKTGGYEALVARREASEQARRDEIARMRRSPTVEGALRVARLTGRITPGAESSMRRSGRTPTSRWPSSRASARTELGYVVGADPHARGRAPLTADRLDRRS